MNPTRLLAKKGTRKAMKMKRKKKKGQIAKAKRKGKGKRNRSENKRHKESKKHILKTTSIHRRTKQTGKSRRIARGAEAVAERIVHLSRILANLTSYLGAGGGGVWRNLSF